MLKLPEPSTRPEVKLFKLNPCKLVFTPSNVAMFTESVNGPLKNPPTGVRPDTPVILISGYGDVELEQRAAKRGAYAFLHKPADPDVFFSVVNRAVLRSQMRRKPEQVLGDDQLWYPQAIEQARQKTNEIAERLRKTLENAGPSSTGNP